MPRLETRLMPLASPDLVRRLAYRLWEERGRPVGSSEHDWFRAEECLRKRILALRPKQVVCGVDDFGTGGGLTCGWTYFALPESAVPEFSKRASAVLPSGINEFHASENFNQHPAAFEEFLELIRDTVQSNFYSLIRVISNSEDWGNDFSGFATRVIEAALQQAGVADRAIISACQACAPPLFTIPRVLDDFGDTIALRVEVDRDDESAPFVTLNATIQGRPFTARRLFAVALDAYADQRFPHAPRVKRDGTSIDILDSKRSWLVQASDVLGNFAMNYAFRDVGPTTAGRLRKAQIFENVFGGWFSGPGPRQFFFKAGDEIAPVQDGAVNWAVTNLPELDLS
jgi:hypothetical protein